MPKIMEKIKEDDAEIVFVDYYHEKYPIYFTVNKATGGVTIDADSVAQAVGANTMSEYMASDTGLDTYLRMKKEIPDAKMFDDDDNIKIK